MMGIDEGVYHMRSREGSKEKLMKQADEKLFAHAYDTYAERIYQFIYFKTYHRETAEDLTSHTFLKAFENFDRFDPARGSMSAWLYQIARNLVIDHYRSRKSTVSVHDIWDLASAEDVQVDVENKVRLEKLQSVIRQLPPEQRDIIIMRVWQELPYKEIALIMGKSEASLKMMYSRTIARLKEHVALVFIVILIIHCSGFR
jgi:RNA polymerase sigma-70 factor (ECF subfamily)